LDDLGLTSRHVSHLVSFSLLVKVVVEHGVVESEIEVIVFSSLLLAALLLILILRQGLCSSCDQKGRLGDEK